MINFEIHSSDSIDVEELSAFTNSAYGVLPIPFKYGETLEEIKAFFRKDCPEFIAIAREGGELKGWAGVYHWTNSMAYFLSWHPLVIPPDPEISQQLVRECIKYTESSGRDRMEVFLMNLTDDPDYRKQGLAKFVLGTSLRRAAENNHEKMILEVDIENQAAAGLYKSVGFKTVKGSISYIWERANSRKTHFRPGKVLKNALCETLNEAERS